MSTIMPTKKANAKARRASQPQEAANRDPLNEDFEAFHHRANAPLDQAALRGGAPQVAALHIFDSEAKYEEVFRMKKVSYDVMVREQAEMPRHWQSFGRLRHLKLT